MTVSWETRFDSQRRSAFHAKSKHLPDIAGATGVNVEFAMQPLAVFKRVIPESAEFFRGTRAGKEQFVQMLKSVFSAHANAASF